MLFRSAILCVWRDAIVDVYALLFFYFRAMNIFTDALDKNEQNIK